MESCVLSKLTRSLHAQRRFPGGETDGGFETTGDGGRKLEEVVFGRDDDFLFTDDDGIIGHLGGVTMAVM